MPGNKRSKTNLGGRALFEQWQALHTSPPATLYHYTTAQGLLSMMKSGHIWATESRYMNDPREFLHGADIMLHVMKRLVKREHPPQALRDVQAQIARHIEEKFQNVRIFCASFCSAGDLLSQWRGYGDSGGGYALGFQPGAFLGRKWSERPPLRSLLRVLYDPRQQEALVAAWGEAVAGGRASADDPHFWRFFSEAIISFKDPAYAEEGEWRLVQFGRAWSEGNSDKMWLHPVEFRERKGQIVPYADLDLGRSTGAHAGKLPISEIVHGPTQDPERSGKALRLLVEQCGYPVDQISLRRSAVPFNK